MTEWSPRARREFAELIAFTERRSPRGASRVARRILKRIDDLRLFSEQGTVVGRGTRRLEVTRTPYLVFYRIRDDVIIIIGIVHSRRKWRF